MYSCILRSLCLSIDNKISFPLDTLFGASNAALVVKNLPANVGDARDVGWILGTGKIPWSRTHSSFLSGKYGQMSLVGYSPCGGKESDTIEHMHRNFVNLTFTFESIIHLTDFCSCV